MKRNNITLQDIKDKLISLKGLDVNVVSNRGRNKIEKFSGRVENIYPAVFTIKIDDGCKTYSYSDILCGNVKINSL